MFYSCDLANLGSATDNGAKNLIGLLFIAYLIVGTILAIIVRLKEKEPCYLGDLLMFGMCWPYAITLGLAGWLGQKKL
jgi:hypothetical protein